MKRSILSIAVIFCFSYTNPINLTEKYNLIVFEGSDWCANCIRLERKILNDASFLQYLNLNNIKLLKIDFPQRKKLSNELKLYNEQLAEKYNFDDVFPTIIITRTDTMFFEKILYQNQTVEELKAEIQDKLQILK